MKGWWGTLLHFNKATTCPVVFPLSIETFNYFKSRCGDAWGDVREGMESIHPGLINVRWQWIQCKVMHRLHYYIKKRLQKCILMQFWQMQHFLVFSSVHPFQPDIFIWYCKMYDLKTETEPCSCLQAPLATYCTADSDVWYVSSVEILKEWKATGAPCLFRSGNSLRDTPWEAPEHQLCFLGNISEYLGPNYQTPWCYCFLAGDPAT